MSDHEMQRAAENEGPNQKLLLVVDDDARSARMLARMLREDGFRVELSFDGASAIGRLGRSPVPDALITDFRMAPVDGVAVARYARSVSHDMRIVMVTGYPQVVGQKLGDLRAAVLPKPIDYSHLGTAVGPSSRM